MELFILMSFFFGGSSKKEVDSVFEILQGKDELQQSNITTLLTFDDSEINGYYKINLLDFFQPGYANIRPKSFSVTIINLNEDKTDSISGYYIHTPIVDSELDLNKLSQFTNRFSFVKKFTLENKQPYLTYCDVDEDDCITRVDISQVTNVNLTPNTDAFMSLGALIFQLNRKDTGKVNIQISIDLFFSAKKY